jgi:nucleotide-binding universal stress UspA family protein
MTLVVVPVRYPLSEQSRATLEKGSEVARERGAELIVLHINLYQNGDRISRRALKSAVERTTSIGPLSQTRYVVRDGFFVEESILDEVANQAADIVVIGSDQASHLRRLVRRLRDDPDIERYLREKLDCEVITTAVP